MSHFSSSNKCRQRLHVFDFSSHSSFTVGKVGELGTLRYFVFYSTVNNVVPGDIVDINNVFFLPRISVVDGVSSNNNTKDAAETGHGSDKGDRDEDPEGEEEEEIEEIDEAGLQYLEEEGEEEDEEEGDVILRPEAVMKLHLEILEGESHRGSKTGPLCTQLHTHPHHLLALQRSIS